MNRFTNASAGFVTALLALALASPAQGALECGDEIKKDLKLKKNLDCSSSGDDALEIAKSNVTVDLNGKKITAAPSYASIYNPNGYDYLTVKDGTFVDGAYAIYSYSGSYANYSNLTIDPDGDNGVYGIYQQYSIAPKATNITVKSPSYGWYGYSNAGLKLKNFTVTDDNNDNGYGVYESYSSGTIDKLKANNAYYGVNFSTATHPASRSRTASPTTRAMRGSTSPTPTPLFDYKYTLKDNTANDSEQYGFYANYDTFGGGQQGQRRGHGELSQRGLLIGASRCRRACGGPRLRRASR